jgi:hypothetical protein
VAQPPTPTQVTVKLPLNTGVVGATVTWTSLRLPTDLEFNDFFSRICAKMDIDPEQATLGYLLTGDRAADIHRLENEEDLRDGMERLLGKIRRARTRQPEMEIRNLVGPCQSYFFFPF